MSKFPALGCHFFPIRKPLMWSCFHYISFIKYVFAGERGLEVCGHGAWPTLFMDLHSGRVRGDSGDHFAGAQPLWRAETNRSWNFRHWPGASTSNAKQRLKISQESLQLSRSRLNSHHCHFKKYCVPKILEEDSVCSQAAQAAQNWRARRACAQPIACGDRHRTNQNQGTHSGHWLAGVARARL